MTHNNDDRRNGSDDSSNDTHASLEDRAENKAPVENKKSESESNSDGDDSNASETNDGEQKEEKDPEDERKTKRQKLIVIVVLVVVALIAIVGGLIWWLNARHWEKTDDAYIDTRITQLAPRASGAVVGVFVNDNQPVRSGQLLVQLDDSAARTQLAQAEASRAQAMAQIAQAHGQVDVARAQFEQAQTNTRGPAAQAGKSERDYRRYAAVRATTQAAVGEQQLDQARATAVNDAASLASARRQVKTARAQLSSTQTQIEAGLAQMKTAEAQMAQARLQIAYARVVAPVDGHVANKTVALGNYAQPGQQLMSVVPNHLWVTANYKETQLAQIRVGQRVEISIDAYPDRTFNGHVQSIQRGAGQSFAVLPSQNATGNFVKVVQRVPVRIVFDHLDSVHFPLGPGMSVEPAVRID